MTLACAHWLCNAQRMTKATRDLISSAVTAEKLGIDRATLTRWRKAGKIRAAYVTPAVVLFDPTEVDRVRAELDAAAATKAAADTH